MARALAAVVAMVAWVGLSMQLNASFARVGSVGATVWIMLRYFTVITNLGLAVVFTGVACRRRSFSSPTLLGGIVLSILLVGVVYGLLLRNLVELSGGAKIADLLLHHATPVVAPFFWLVCVPKGGLRRGDPWIWAAFPLGYLIYALVRGSIEGVYAYPFMDVTRIGWARTGLNALCIAVSFIVLGHVIYWLDARLGRRSHAA